jgi:hypothetical protein
MDSDSYPICRLGAAQSRPGRHAKLYLPKESE